MRKEGCWFELTSHKKIIEWWREWGPENGYEEKLLMHFSTEEMKISHDIQDVEWLRKEFKEMGVRTGIPDLFLAIPRNGYHGLWIEIKATGGEMGAHQRLVAEILIDQGFKVETLFRYKEPRDCIVEYLRENQNGPEFVPQGNHGDRIVSIKQLRRKYQQLSEKHQHSVEQWALLEDSLLKKIEERDRIIETMQSDKNEESLRKEMDLVKQKDEVLADLHCRMAIMIEDFDKEKRCLYDRIRSISNDNEHLSNMVEAYRKSFQPNREIERRLIFAQRLCFVLIDEFLNKQESFLVEMEFSFKEKKRWMQKMLGLLCPEISVFNEIKSDLDFYCEIASLPLAREVKEIFKIYQAGRNNPENFNLKTESK